MHDAGKTFSGFVKSSSIFGDTRQSAARRPSPVAMNGWPSQIAGRDADQLPPGPTLAQKYGNMLAGLSGPLPAHHRPCKADQCRFTMKARSRHIGNRDFPGNHAFTSAGHA